MRSLVVILLLAAVSGATAILHTQQCPGQIGNSVCANFSVPLDWSDQNSGENIDVFATIFGSGNGGNNLDDIDGVVWALNFGCDGWLVNTAFDWMQALSNEKNYVIIWPNMRGDGLSTPRLECSDDPDGIAGGRYLLTTDADGAGECVPLDGDAPAGAAHLALDARALGSLYLGGVSASTFAAAGRITEQSPGAAVAADAVLRSPIAPRLSIWF